MLAFSAATSVNIVMNLGFREGLRLARAACRALAAGLVMCAAAGAAGADARLDALAQARHDVVVSEQVLQRLTARVAAARANPTTGTEERARLDEYLARVRALVAANRERVRDLERAAAQNPAASAAGAGAQPAAMTEAEKVALLDRNLNGSLEAFDQMLLDEARKARTRDAETRSASRSGGGEDKAGRTGKGSATRNGESSSAEGEAASEDGGGRAAESGTERSAEAGAPSGTSDGAAGGPIGGRERGTPGPQASAPPPPDVGDGSDDDIVARQIRKAAEAEPDPELRKKLWDEYRKYKQGIAPSAS